MKLLLLQGSFNKDGNTKQFSVPFAEELKRLGAELREEWLCDYNIAPCRGCRACQFKIGETGCAQQDDFTLLFDMICGADVVVLASPIYIGGFPGHVKSFIDRLTYSAVKLYGDVKAPSLVPGKGFAMLITCGAPPKLMFNAVELIVNIMCKRLEWSWLGWSGGTDPGKPLVFMNEKKSARAREFAAELVQKYTELKA